MKVASLFAGIGGFDLAFERAGAETVLQAEIDPVARAVLEAHWPNVQRINDVHEVGKLDVDLICGGFPCQDVSVGGKRAGLAGERSGLWFEFARILDESRPGWCLVENVPGLLSSNDGRDMGTVLGTLADIGYGFAYRVLDASFFGVPQRRRRVFIVGCLGDAERAVEILFEPEGGGGDSGSSLTSRSTSPGATRTRAGGAGRGLLIESGVVSALSARMGTAGHGDVANAQAGWLIPFRKTTRAHHANDSEAWEEANHTNALDAEGNVTRTARAIAYSVFPKSGQGSELRARETDIAPTLSATDGKLHDRGKRIVDDLNVRQLMPIECERLQGFPDHWTDSAEFDTHQYRLLGNALAVPVVEWIAHRVVASHKNGSAATGSGSALLGGESGSQVDGVAVGPSAPDSLRTSEQEKRMPTALQARAREIAEAAEVKPKETPNRRAKRKPITTRVAVATPVKEIKPAKHCAKFSDSLLPIALEILTATGLKPNARIIDTFAGTGKGVDYLRAHSKFRAEGLELEPEFIDSPHVKIGNATATGYRANTFDAAFWSPSYGNRMADKDLRASVAGTYAKSLGRLASEGSSCHLQWNAGPSGDAYRRLHVDSYTELRRIMRDGGYALLNIKDHYRNKELQGVPAWHKATLESLGFEFVREVFIETPGQRHGANRLRADGEWLYLFRLNK